MYFNIFVHFLITFIFEYMRNLRIKFWMNISKACKLIEMPSKSISWIFERLVSTAHKTASFYHIMSAIKCRCSEILIYWMNLEILKRICWCRTVLPYISNYIIKSFVLEKINWAWRQPILHIYICNFAMLPIKMVFFNNLS